MNVKASTLNPEPQWYSKKKKEWISVLGNRIINTNQLCDTPGCNNLLTAYQLWTKHNRNKSGLGHCTRECLTTHKRMEKE